MRRLFLFLTISNGCPRLERRKKVSRTIDEIRFHPRHASCRGKGRARVISSFHLYAKADRDDVFGRKRQPDPSTLCPSYCLEAQQREREREPDLIVVLAIHWGTSIPAQQNVAMEKC
ncbi:hypothetical protein CH063_12191 [Colletotrichum higginsianum]|uniref:Uncharacterized protein n=1 Tax=Colletotrichum higginsianum (strain IMI 349063) TaxID=759273 RepID=H1VPF0_COLHI|nr:hypothetical protein CH063_12191 [Colletotrichum higginsianum]